MGLARTAFYIASVTVAYCLGTLNERQNQDEAKQQLQERVAVMDTIDYKVKSLLIEADTDPGNLESVFQKYKPGGDTHARNTDYR